MVNRIIGLITLFLLFSNMSAVAATSATLDRSKIYSNETVQLTVKTDNTDTSRAPDISELSKHFDVLGQNQSSSTVIINGKVESSKSWIYQLAPKRDGLITIPSITVGKEKSQPISLKVLPQNKAKQYGDAQPFFVDVSSDKKTAYVQEEILVTVQVNTRNALSDVQLESLQPENYLIDELNNSSYERTINGQRYITYERIYSISPQESGQLTIPALTAAGVIPYRNSFNPFNRGKTVQVRSEPLTIDIQEIPSSSSGKNWLPARELRLADSWSAEPTTMQLGDSITRTIKTTAKGLRAEQLPPIEIKTNDLFKIYPDKPELNNTGDANGIIGERMDTIAIVATKPGKLTLPEISIEWWDINTNSTKKAVLPEISITVVGNIPAPSPQQIPPQTVPAEQSIAPPAAPEPQVIIQESPTWKIATAISSLMAMLFMILFLRERLKKSVGTEEKVVVTNITTFELSKLKSACSKGELATIRNEMLHWAKTSWPRLSIHSTADIARVCGHRDIQRWMGIIDKGIFNTADASNHDWMELYQLIETLEKGKDQGKNSGLASLYPS